jgi:membrane protein YdbS with pleckstrin-like domain
MDEFLASLPTPNLLAASINRFLTQWFVNGDESVPGSTDGVVLMGIIIVLIIIIPTIATRRRWMR